MGMRGGNAADKSVGVYSVVTVNYKLMRDGWRWKDGEILIGGLLSYYCSSRSNRSVGRMRKIKKDIPNS